MAAAKTGLIGKVYSISVELKAGVLKLIGLNVCDFNHDDSLFTHDTVEKIDNVETLVETFNITAVFTSTSIPAGTTSLDDLLDIATAAINDKFPGHIE